MEVSEGVQGLMSNDCIRTEHNLFQTWADTYHENFIAKTHPEVMKWPLVSRDRMNLMICLGYVLFVNVIGPRFMKNRQPFDLRWLMVPYNVILVIFNFFIFTEYAKFGFLHGRAPETSCSTLDVSSSPDTLRLAEITWYFYISKYIELSDTVFFVLRKKDRQLSRLHLVHHSTVPLMVFGLLRSEPGGYNVFFPLANSFVHCIMYAYYAISALGDDVTIHLKFKKYITMTQMIQFILVLYYVLSRPYYGCNTTKMSFIGHITIAGFFFVLFCNFYYNEYLLMKEDARKRREDQVVNGQKKCK